MDKSGFVSTEDESGVFSKALERVTARNDQWSLWLFDPEKGHCVVFVHGQSSGRAFGSVLDDNFPE